MNKKDSESAVGDLLHLVLKAHPAFAANPLGDWKELVGDQIARHSLPKSLKKKVLVIVVHDSIWKHHLELNKQDLMSKINRKRVEPLVEEIVIKVGTLPEAPPVLNPYHDKVDKIGNKKYQTRKKQKTPLRNLTADEQALIKSLPDPELRRIALRLLRRVPADEQS